MTNGGRRSRRQDGVSCANRRNGSQAARMSSAPAARKIAPQTPPPWRKSVLAALTMASTFRVVMSCCRIIKGICFTFSISRERGTHSYSEIFTLLLPYPKPGRSTQEVSLQNSRVLQKDFQSDQYEDNAAGQLRSRLKFRADLLSDDDAEGGKGEGGHPDDRHRRQDIYF